MCRPSRAKRTRYDARAPLEQAEHASAGGGDPRLGGHLAVGDQGAAGRVVEHPAEGNGIVQARELGLQHAHRRAACAGTHVGVEEADVALDGPEGALSRGGGMGRGDGHDPWARAAVADHELSAAGSGGTDGDGSWPRRGVR